MNNIHPQTEDTAPVSLWETIVSVLWAFYGVQSNKNRRRDFSRGNAGLFIAVGFGLTTLFVLLMVGVAAGGLSANRLAGRIRVRSALRIANAIAIAGAACFMLAELTGWLSVVSVIAPVVVFMVGAGMASPFALTGAVSVNPHAIGAASGLYGFTQMAYGALCTVIVEVWRPGSVFTVAAVLLVSSLLGQIALSLAVRPRP